MFQNPFKSLQARTPEGSVSALLHQQEACKGAMLGGCTIPLVYRAHTDSLYSCNTATAIKTRHSRDRDCSCFTYKEMEVLKAKCPARSHRGRSGGTWT